MFRLLMKIRFAALKNSLFGRMNARRAEKGSRIKTVLLSVLLLYLAVAMFGSAGFLLAGVGEGLLAAGLTDLYFSIVAFLITVIGVVITVFTAKSMLYDANDNELLLSMPIPTRDILGSRIAVMLLMEVGSSLLIVIPATVVYCLYGPVTVWGIAAVLTGTVLLDLLVVSVSSVIGCAIGWVTAKMRHKAIASILLMAVFLVGYFALCFKMEEIMLDLIRNGAAIAQALAAVLPPMYAFGAAVAGDVWSLARLFLWGVIPFVLVVLLLSKIFFAMTMAGKNRHRVEYRKKPMKPSGAPAAIMKKELSRLISLPAYLMNACIGILFEVLLTGAVVIFHGDITAYIDELFAVVGTGIDPGEMVPYALMVLVLFLTSMNLISAPSLSLEGQNLWILRSAPVSPMTVYMAKAAAGLVITVPAHILLCTVCALFLPMGVMETVWLFLIALLGQIFVSLFGVTANVWMPRFDWVNATLVVKQSGAVAIAMFGSMAVFLTPVLLYIFCFADTVGLLTYAGLTALYLLVLSAACLLYLRGPGSRKYYRM